MNYKEYTASMHLRPFIEKFWTLTSDAFDTYPMEQMITPNAVEGLMITFPPVVQKFVVNNHPTVLPEMVLFLQPHAPWKLVTEGCSEILGVFFRAGSIHTLLKSGLTNIVGQVMETQAFLGSRPVRILVDRVVEAPPDQRITILEEFFTRHFCNLPHQQNRIALAVRLIQKYKGLMPIEKIAASLGITRQAIARQFTEKVGVSPKQYSRLIHFNTVQQYLKKYPRSSWIDITYRFDYSDQSHLIKDFYHFTGTSPKGYIALDTFLVNSFVRMEDDKRF